MGRAVNRGETLWGQIQRRDRPVVVLTRQSVIGMRDLVTVAEITTQARGLAVEIPLDDGDDSGLDRPSVINADGRHTIEQFKLTRMTGRVSDRTLRQACAAVNLALCC